MDFGLARRATPTRRPAADADRGGDGDAVLHAARSRPAGDHDAIGPPADVYAWASSCTSCSPGGCRSRERPSASCSPRSNATHRRLPSALNADIDPALDAIIFTALAKDPQQRFATAGALADALDAYAKGDHDALVAKHGAAKQAAELTGPYIPADEATSFLSPAKRTRRRPHRIAMAAGVIGGSLLALLAWVIYEQINAPAPSDASKPPAQPAPSNQPAHSKRKSPKPVEFPKQPTLVEVPGWQVLTDATKEEMQQWLDDRKKNKHSVVWLDAVQVGDKPAFAAVAALDDRESDWRVFLDLTEAEVNNAALSVYQTPE